MKSFPIVLLVAAFTSPCLLSGCSSNEPQVSEMTEEYENLYDAYDKEFQASSNEADPYAEQ